MDEYIKREDIEQKIQDGLNNLVLGHDAIEILGMIYEMPTADVAPVRHGRWLGWGKSGTPTYENYGTCSVCGEDAEIYTEHRNYCPNCGAKMDGDDGG